MASIAATWLTKTLTCSSSPHALTKTLQIPLSVNQRRRIPQRRIQHKTAIKVSSSSPSAPPGSSPGLYSAQQFELTAQNVDLVLEDVRPYLIADGGNVDVVSVEDGIISLKLQGACGSCPSSTTTMKMGIERVLKEKFGDAVKDIRQVNDDEEKETTVEAVNRHLDILRPAIKNYGGSVEVLSIEGEECVVKYIGPESIGEVPRCHEYCPYWLASSSYQKLKVVMIFSTFSRGLRFAFLHLNYDASLSMHLSFR